MTHSPQNVDRTRPIRVLAVDHTAGVTLFRRKFAALAAFPEIDLTVLAPARWMENYRVVEAAPGDVDGYRLLTGSAGWPGYENRAFFRSGFGSAIRRLRPDILHLWEEPFSVITLQALGHAAVWAPRTQAIFFSSDNLSRDYRYSYRPSWFYAGVERVAHHRCAAGTAVSGEVAEVLRAKGFQKRLEVIPHGLDLENYPAAETNGGEIGRRAPAAEVRARLGLDPPVVGFVGRLLPQKGADLLLHAAAALDGTRPSVALLGDGPERVALEALASDLGISDRTSVIPGKPHAEVASLLSCFDVLAVPSRTTPKWKEQFGRVLIEGMAAGCVVIGSSSGAIPEVLGNAGLVFREDDASDLARVLGRALREPGLATNLRLRGRTRVREHYTWDVVASKLIRLYRDLLAPEDPIRLP